MRKTLWLYVATLALALSGCAAISTSSPVTGFIYQGAKGTYGGPGSVGSKRGESCASSILGLIGTGDASAEAAAKAGGITTIGTVDSKNFGILGIYATNCTVVTGE